MNDNFHTISERQEFHNKLKEIYPNISIYFQPPASIKMSYPCIIYNLDNINMTRADNKIYTAQYRYALTYVSNKPDDTDYQKLFDTFEYVNLERYYRADNLNHYLITILY